MGKTFKPFSKYAPKNHSRFFIYLFFSYKRDDVLTKSNFLARKKINND